MKKILLILIISLISGISPLINSEEKDDISKSSSVASFEYNTVSCYYNDEVLYQTNNFSTYYFNNLTNNFGKNIKGSSSYVALAMLLSYYDTYWDDSIIPENYDMVTILNENALTLYASSPGIYTENSSIVNIDMLTTEYYQAIEQYSNAHMHLRLIEMGKKEFNHYVFDDEINPCGINLHQLHELMDYYLYDYLELEETEISYTFQNSNVRDFVIQNIKDGKPVLVRMGSTVDNSLGHAFILYDYDEVSDELYGHWGLSFEPYSFEHIKLSTTPYDVFWDATVLNVNIPHTCSNNYKYTTDSAYGVEYCPCIHDIHENNK